VFNIEPDLVKRHKKAVLDDNNQLVYGRKKNMFLVGIL